MSELSHQPSQRAWTPLVILLCLLIWTALAWVLSSQMSDIRSIVLDDSYITYIYARNLADGFGLRYNPGDLLPTEGSSSLLHTALLALGIRSGFDPLNLTRGLNLGLYFVTPVAMALLVWRGLKINLASVFLGSTVVIILLALLPETVPHMGSGLETMLFLYACLMMSTWALIVVFRPEKISTPLSIGGGIIGITVLLLRPEGVVLAGATLLATVAARVLQGGKPWAELRAIAPALILFGTATVALIVWKTAYFGDTTPNAYWVKSHNEIFGSNGKVFPGAKFVLGFIGLRWLPLAMVGLGIHWARKQQRQDLGAILILLLPALLVLAAYTMVIHEAAGNYRYGYALIAPLLALLAMSMAKQFQRRPHRALVATLIMAYILPSLNSANNTPFFHWIKAPVARATAWVGYEPDQGGVVSAALDLRDTGLGGQANVLLSAAGMIPWYSRFNAIDWIGLNNNTLSGKAPLSIDQVWDYIGQQNPDVIVSFLPPASPGSTGYQDDPAFDIRPIQNTLHGQGTKLFQNWDQDKISKMLWHEMAFIRDEAVFGACYGLLRDWVLIIYIRRDTPLRQQIADSLGQSNRSGCDRPDLVELYHGDPRLHGKVN